MSADPPQSTKSVDLSQGTAHTDDYGSLRRCWTTDCDTRFTSSRRCRRCSQKTSTQLYREDR